MTKFIVHAFFHPGYKILLVKNEKPIILFTHIS